MKVTGNGALKSRLDDGSGSDQVAQRLHAFAAVDFGSISNQVAQARMRPVYPQDRRGLVEWPRARLKLPGDTRRRCSDANAQTKSHHPGVTPGLQQAASPERRRRRRQMYRTLFKRGGFLVSRNCRSGFNNLGNCRIKGEGNGTRPVSFATIEKFGLPVAACYHG